MSKVLVIAEKPSLKRDIERVWAKNPTGDDVSFACFAGHTMVLQAPDDYDVKFKSWDKALLPIIPQEFLYKVSKGKEKMVSDINTIIKNGKFDFIVNACDAAREGQLIFWSFYSAMGHKIPVKRLWAQDTTDAGLKKAIDNLIPETNAELVNLQKAARLRADMDWLIGINFTRAFTLATNEKTPIGRVMTPTLKMIVDREKEINNFKPQKYYEVEISLEKNSMEFSATRVAAPEFKETKIATKKEAEDIINSLAKGLKVKSISTEENKVYAPTLYSLTELQKEANAAYGYTAAKTLEIAQSLYETKKLLTYPRTECRYIPKNMIAEIPKKIAAISEVPELEKTAKSVSETTIKAVLSTKKYVDDSKLTDHHAIVPTNQKPDLSKLSQDEANIYLLVAKKLLALFLGPYVCDKTVAYLESSKGETFVARGKVEKDKGYTALYKQNTKDVILPPLTANEVVLIKDKEVKEKETTPPKRFNDSSILDAMLKAGSNIKNKELRGILRETSGIGTSATRAAIVEKLFENKWVERKGKAIYATELGIKVIETLGERDITSPIITADWEKKLREVESGKDIDLKKELEAFILKETNSLLEIKTQLGTNSTYVAKVVGKCPICGNDFIEGKNGYMCKEYKKSCSVYIPKTLLNAKISEKDIKTLLEGGSIKKKLTFKSGSKSEKELILDESGKLSYKKAEVQQTGICPSCGGELKKTEKAYYCSCGFMIPARFVGKEFSFEEVEKLHKGELIEKCKCKSEKGNEFTANIGFKNGAFTLDFCESQAEEEEDKSQMAIVGKCPKCGKDVLAGKNFYVCSGFPNECDFKVARVIKGAQIENEDMARLLTGKETRKLEFTWKSGKKGLARMKMADRKIEFIFD